jgi:hypothetical protein
MFAGGAFCGGALVGGVLSPVRGFQGSITGTRFVSCVDALGGADIGGCLLVVPVCVVGGTGAVEGTGPVGGLGGSLLGGVGIGGAGDGGAFVGALAGAGFGGGFRTGISLSLGGTLAAFLAALGAGSSAVEGLNFGGGGLPPVEEEELADAEAPLTFISDTDCLHDSSGTCNFWNSLGLW